MANKPGWEQVKTAKRYLHPPFSGYLCTQWRDFKVLMGKFETKCAPALNFSAYPAAGIRVLVGEELESVEHTQTQMLTRDDGVPVHCMFSLQEKFAMHMESFCNTGTIYPSTFTRITVANNSDSTVSDLLGLLIRSGQENYMTGTQVDAYTHYDGNVGNWGFLQPSWKWDGQSLLTDETAGYAIEILNAEGFDLRWQGAKKGYVWHQRHLLRAAFTLQPGQSLSLTLRMYLLDHKDPMDSYETERARAVSFWVQQLQKIRNMPGKPEHAPVVKNLTIQLLQMFSTYPDEGFIAPRQGGMNRFFWSVEAMDFLIPLERMGGLSEYTRTAYDFFFDHCQIKEGEEAGQVILSSAWGSTTGGAIRACANHLIYGSREDYLRYRDVLYLAFRWIQRQREKSYTQNCLYKGIFPAMRGTDWPGEFQSWCMTDGHSLLAYRDLAQAFEQYDDPCAGEIRAAYQDYLAVMKGIYAQEAAKYTDPDELLLPNRLGIPQTDPPMGAYQGDGPAMLLLAGVMDPCSNDTQRVENFFRNRRCMQNGLTGLMCDGRLRPNKDYDPTAGHMWYLSTCDLRWFYTWLAQGKPEKAEQVIHAQMNYGMSKEYHFVERFADNDPFYMPWQPNASANGRLLSMLADFYGMRQLW